MKDTAPIAQENTARRRAGPLVTCRPPKPFLDALKALKRPLILGHVTPDADSLGACLGLCLAARQAGIDAVVGLPETGTSERFTFMLELAREAPLVAACTADRPFDAIIILDTANEKRINLGPSLTLPPSAPRFNIDHHITNTDFGAMNWVDPHASSTCEMMARLLMDLHWPFNANVASLLYAGLHGDTGGFSLPSTSAEALETAAVLVRAGADVSHIGEQLCRSQGRQDFELLRRVYDHTHVVAGGAIAYSYLTHQDIVESGCRAEDIDDQVSIPRALRGVRVAMLFSEGEPGVVRINLRGEGRTTVLELAERFGGGGHAQSAGVRVRNKPMHEVIDAIVAAACELLHLPHP